MYDCEAITKEHLDSFWLEPRIESGALKKRDTLDELAKAMKFDADQTATFKATIERYNELVAAGEDVDFGKPAYRLSAVDEPPFYGVRLWPKVHHCMGGVKTDLECRVVDMDLQVIPGLYAAGEAVGGIHGACRLGSCATADCLVNGRIAGQNAAKEQGA